MTTHEHDLERLQRWVLSVITHPGGIVEGVESDAAREHVNVAPADVESIVDRSKNLDAVSRLAVYGNAYFARLLECVEEEFPALLHALGEETFRAFAAGYLIAHPSTSHTLADLSAGFPAYLRDSQPEADRASDEPAWSDFVIDLATLERTYSEVFDGPGVENDRVLSPQDLAAITPERWPECRLEPVPCLRLLRCSYPVHEYKTTVSRGETPLPPRPEPTRLVVTRREYVVRRTAVGEDEFALLSDVASGERIGDAVAALAERSTLDDAALATHLQTWFRGWTAAGYFRGLRE